MLTDDKLLKFKDIAERLITKEYLGIPNMGKDIEYEEQLTNAGANYLISVFYKTGDSKKELHEVMKKKDIQYKSNILKYL